MYYYQKKAKVHKTRFRREVVSAAKIYLSFQRFRVKASDSEKEEDGVSAAATEEEEEEILGGHSD